MTGEGFAYACWVRLNFNLPFRPPRERQHELRKFWDSHERHKWWCWGCDDFHVNVG